MAAYHEANADRMGAAAPRLIPIVVALLSHQDAEIQAHAATTLANLAHGSPSYQGDAGEAGAIEALLDVCRGRAGCQLDALLIVQPCGDADDYERSARGSRSQRKEVDREMETSVEGGASADVRDEKTTWDEKHRKTARKAELRTMVSETEAAANADDLSEKGGEEAGSETMDVDAILAATAALANLLCYSDANSVRLVDAGGIGVLVGLVSSYRPQNLLDFDQVGEYHDLATVAVAV